MGSACSKGQQEQVVPVHASQDRNKSGQAVTLPLTASHEDFSISVNFQIKKVLNEEQTNHSDSEQLAVQQLREQLQETQSEHSDLRKEMDQRCSALQQEIEDLTVQVKAKTEDLETKCEQLRNQQGQVQVLQADLQVQVQRCLSLEMENESLNQHCLAQANELTETMKQLNDALWTSTELQATYDALTARQRKSLSSGRETTEVGHHCRPSNRLSRCSHKQHSGSDLTQTKAMNSPCSEMRLRLMKQGVHWTGEFPQTSTWVREVIVEQRRHIRRTVGDGEKTGSSRFINEGNGEVYMLSATSTP